MGTPLLVAMFLAATADVSASAEPSGPQWSSSLQLGGGQLAEDAMAILRPRFGVEGKRLQVFVGAPLLLQLADARPHGPAREPLGWRTAWDDPETYAALLEELSWRSAGERAELHAGRLRQESLGYGVLVDQFTGSLDPSAARSGARLDIDLGAARFSALSESLVRPRLIAASLDLAPLELGAAARTSSLRVGLEAAADLRAPSASDDERAVGGADTFVSVAPLAGDGYRFELFAAGASLLRPDVPGAFGAHAGVQLDLLGELVARDDALVLRLEGIAGGRGYVPGYFDAFYAVERFRAPGPDQSAKVDVLAPAGYGLRGRVDVRLGRSRAGAYAEHAFAAQRSNASLYFEHAGDAWKAAALVAQRGVGEAAELVALAPSTHALVDVAVRLHEGWFGFGYVHHGLRPEPAGDARRVTDWILGVGYGAAGALD